MSAKMKLIYTRDSLGKNYINNYPVEIESDSDDAVYKEFIH